MFDKCNPWRHIEVSYCSIVACIDKCRAASEDLHVLAFPTCENAPCISLCALGSHLYVHIRIQEAGMCYNLSGIDLLFKLKTHHIEIGSLTSNVFSVTARVWKEHWLHNIQWWVELWYSVTFRGREKCKEGERRSEKEKRRKHRGGVHKKWKASGFVTDSWKTCH